jgi:hypothetical protein
VWIAAQRPFEETISTCPTSIGIYFAGVLPGGIWFASMDSAPTLLTQDSDAFRVVAIACDDEFVYYLNNDCSPLRPCTRSSKGRVMRVSSKAGARNAATCIAETGVFGDYLAKENNVPGDIAVYDGTVYFIRYGNDGELARIGNHGDDGKETKETLVSSLQGATSLSVDDTHVYWVNHDESTVMRIDHTLTEAQPETVLEAHSALDKPVAIVGDDTAIYWTNEGSGTVMKLAKPPK